MYPEKWFFLKVYRFEKGWSIFQISTKSYFSRSCIIFEIDFFFQVGLPPEAFYIGVKKQLKSQAKKTLITDQFWLLLMEMWSISLISLPWLSSSTTFFISISSI